VQRTARPRSATLAEFNAAIDRAEWRVRWCRLVLWYRIALGRESSEAREELAIEKAHLALLREDRRLLFHANERRRGQVSRVG